MFLLSSRSFLKLLSNFLYTIDITRNNVLNNELHQHYIFYKSNLIHSLTFFQSSHLFSAKWYKLSGPPIFRIVFFSSCNISKSECNLDGQSTISFLKPFQFFQTLKELYLKLFFVRQSEFVWYQNYSR